MSQVERTLSIAITGAGGSGVVTLGTLFLNALASAGYYALMSRSSGPQIRGGESAVMLRVGVEPVRCQDDNFKLFIALDWFNFSRFADEIPLTENSYVIYDPDMGDIPPEVLNSGAQLKPVPFKSLAKALPGGRPNMLALGLLGKLLNIDETKTIEAVSKVLKHKGPEVIEQSSQGITQGYTQAPTDIQLSRIGSAIKPTSRWNITGNEASGFGAIRGGVRLVAAYPITPASEVLEWMAPSLEKVGGTLIQAEDELASINMVIGASFGGVPALTATSGPGLSLMMEALGLAVASETPVVVINVMRGGPSTGIPTKSEQSDLNIAVYGMHGDAPHLVLAPLDIGDCAFTSQWAVALAERLQTAAIVLSDQSLGQARAVIPPPQEIPIIEGRALCEADENYQRYALTQEGISHMAVPGTADCIYTADGLEHTEFGMPSSMAHDHQQQLDKRHNKINSFDYGEHWAVSDGTGDIGIITWGSSSGSVEEAAQRLRQEGIAVQTLAIRLISPLPVEKLKSFLRNLKTIVIVEQNHQGQLFQHLNSLKCLPDNATLLAHPGPLAIRPAEVVNFIKTLDPQPSTLNQGVNQ